MNLTNPRIAAATAILVAIETIIHMIVAGSASQTPPPSAPVLSHTVSDAPVPLAERSRQGDACATFEYARRIELGLGTRRDAALAAYWYQVAEDQGYELPEEVVARMFP